VQLVEQRFDLRPRTSGGEHYEVCDTALPVEFEDADFLGLLLIGEVGGGRGQC
jgi:hypothetical protein